MDKIDKGVFKKLYSSVDKYRKEVEMTGALTVLSIPDFIEYYPEYKNRDDEVKKVIENGNAVGWTGSENAYKRHRQPYKKYTPGWKDKQQ